MSKTKTDAFTLIEITLALGVSAIVLAAIGGVLFSALRLRERTTALLDQAAPLHQALNTLRRDLQGALPPGGVLAGDFKIGSISSGTVQSLGIQFFTSTGVLRNNEPWGDVQEVSYVLREPAQRSRTSGRDLIRTVIRDLLPTMEQEADEQWLMGNVQTLDFAGYDGVDWRDTWDSSLGNTNLPSAVRVRIQLASEGRPPEPMEMVIPLLVQSRTNQTQSAGGGQ